MANISFSEKKAGPGGVWYIWTLAGLLGGALGWFAAAATVIEAGGQAFGQWPEIWRYADTKLPMISSADGFHYLSQAENFARGALPDAHPIARLVVTLSNAVGQPLEWGAFYLSLFTHLGLGLCLAAWCRRLGAGYAGAFLAAFLMALMPGWIERGGASKFDTDLMILLFWQAGLFFLAGASGEERLGRRFAFTLAAALASFALLALFWEIGLALGLVTLAVWAFVFPPPGVWGVKLRLIVTALGAAWLAALFLLPREWAPAPAWLMQYVDYLRWLGSLAFGEREELFYSSIKELKSLTFPELTDKVGGSLAGGLGFMLAALILFIRRRGVRMALLLAVACILAGMKSNRLVYLGLFPMALAAATLPAMLTEIAYSRLPRLSSRITWCGGLVLLMLLIFSAFQWDCARNLDYRWEREHDVLLEPLREEGAEGGAFWNWWDDGYFLAARAPGSTPLFDGGSQDHITAYIAAHPLVMDDRRAAARWMRFFALHGQRWLAMTPLINLWGDLAQAYANLELIFGAENLADLPPPLLAQINTLPGGAEYLFPKGRVYWYLPANFLNLANWWVPLGLAPQPDEALVNRRHLEIIERNKFAYDETQKSLTVTQDLWGRGYKNFGQVYNVSKQALAAPWPRGGAPYIVYSDFGRRAYICDDFTIKSLPVYMMATGGNLPQFKRLSYAEDWGGLWEILP